MVDLSPLPPIAFPHSDGDGWGGVKVATSPETRHRRRLAGTLLSAFAHVGFPKHRLVGAVCERLVAGGILELQCRAACGPSPPFSMGLLPTYPTPEETVT